MRIENITVGSSVETTATFTYGKFRDFGIIPDLCSLWGRKPEDITNVRLTIIESDIIFSDYINQDGYDPNSEDYFTFIDVNDDGSFDLATSLTYGTANMFRICFPYGPDSKRYYKGKRTGYICRFKVEQI